jgi:hypothetical protein
MPEPLSIAVATILAAKAAEGFASETGKGAFGFLKQLVGLLRRRFAGDTAASEDLTKVENHPQEERNVTVLADTIDRYIHNDDELRNELAEILKKAQRDPEVTSFLTTVLPGGVVGKITNIGDVHGNVTF